MTVRYRIEFEVDTSDYVETLGEIDDVLQDKFAKGNPRVLHITIMMPRQLQDGTS